MKLISGSLFLAFIVILIGHSGCQSTSGHSAIFSEDTLELGRMRVGEKKLVTLALHNPTAKTMNLLSVKGDCDCIDVRSFPKNLSTGQQAKLVLTYNSQYDAKLTGVIYKNVVVQVSEKPFIYSIKLRVTIT